MCNYLVDFEREKDLFLNQQAEFKNKIDMGAFILENVFCHSDIKIEYMKKLASQPNSTHPTYDQRMDKARQQGFQLSRGGIEQMDALMTHLA
jgi:hypothetical protein